MSVEIRVPTLGESIVEAIITQWNKQEGDTIAVGDVLLELETDKVTLEVPAEHQGVLLSKKRQAGETVNIDDVIGIIGESGEQVAADNGSQPNAEGVASGQEEAKEDLPDQSSEIAATPVAQQIATQHAVNIRDVPGSGPGGRVTKEDVLSHIQPATSPEPAPAAAAPTPAPAIAEPKPPAAPQPAVASTISFAPEPSADRREERVKMSRRRQTIAKRLVEAQHTAAMLTTFNEIDLSAVMNMRQRHKGQFQERHGIGLGFMSFFVKATIGALKAFPYLNAEIQGDEIVVKHYYDMGIAVGTEQGLVVPVLRDADRKTFAQIEQGIADLAERARTNALSLDDLQGGTFSITNGGIYGSLMSTPILNAPQVGILGMHKIEKRPVVVADAIEIRPMMYVALSYDHRIVDGSDAVRFLVRIKELVESPEALLLEG